MFPTSHSPRGRKWWQMKFWNPSCPPEDALSCLYPRSCRTTSLYKICSCPRIRCFPLNPATTTHAKNAFPPHSAGTLPRLARPVISPRKPSPALSRLQVPLLRVPVALLSNSVYLFIRLSTSQRQSHLSSYSHMEGALKLVEEMPTASSRHAKR